MVLQQDGKIPVWGTADPDENVKVAIDSSSAETVADKDGHWRVDLPALPMNATATTMTVTGKNTLTFQDVLIGDVWLASGQSNMEFPMKEALNGKDAIAKSANPQIRLFLVQRQVGIFPKSDVKGAWVVCGPDSVTNFSAVAYFFGQDIQQTLKRPIGLIGSYWGGTPAEAWTSFEVLKQIPSVALYVAEVQKQRDAAQTAQKESSAQPDSSASDQPAKPAATPADPPYTESSVLFNGMIAPLIPYGMKGVIWYQGEQNAWSFKNYATVFQALVTDWRARWGEGNFPFILVQLANFGPRRPEPGDAEWARIREAQLQTMEALPDMGMAVIIDLGMAGNIHPVDKLDVGKRLAAAAKHTAYGQDVPYSGPIYDSMTIDGDKVRIKFRNVGTGLAIGTAPWFSSEYPPPSTTNLVGFAIAGADKNWVWADARIDGDDVVVSSDKVSAPVAVRYGWAANPETNLYNKEGFPASPFRTDSWDFVAPPKP